jgi:hypothetical protein
MSEFSYRLVVLMHGPSPASIKERLLSVLQVLDSEEVVQLPAGEHFYLFDDRANHGFVSNQSLPENPDS